MEFFFTTNGDVHYFSPDKNIWNTFAFVDDLKEIHCFDVQNPIEGEPIKKFKFSPDEYDQVKFLFQQYLTRNGAALNATEVYEDRERINRQSLQTLEMSKVMSDQNLEKQALQLEFNREELDEMKKQLRRRQMGMGDGVPSKILS